MITSNRFEILENFEKNFQLKFLKIKKITKDPKTAELIDTQGDHPLSMTWAGAGALLSVGGGALSATWVLVAEPETGSIYSFSASEAWISIAGSLNPFGSSSSGITKGVLSSSGTSTTSSSF